MNVRRTMAIAAASLGMLAAVALAGPAGEPIQGIGDIVVPVDGGSQQDPHANQPNNPSTGAPGGARPTGVDGAAS